LSSQLIYQSPLRIFDSLGLDSGNIDSEALRLERKRLLLEIQISPTQTTILNGKEVGKNDVIELFDRAEGVSDLAFHRIIFKHPALLNLLETQKIPELISYVDLIRFESKEEESAFRTFVSPYLAEAYAKASTSILRNGNYLSLLQTSAYFRLLTQSDVYVAFQNIENYCSILEQNLKHLAVNNLKFVPTEYEFIYYQPFYDLINKLSVYFDNLPSIVASAIINFTVDCQHKVGRGKHLVTLSDQARRLQCSAELKSILIKNREAFWNSKEQTISFNPNKVWRGIVYSVLIIAILYKFTSRCETYTNTNPNFNEPANLEQLMRDFDEQQANDPERIAHRNETFLLNLHEATVWRVKNRQFNATKLYADQAPKLTPTIDCFDSTLTHSPTQKVMLQNNTNAEMLMILMDDDKFISLYVGKFETVEFTLSTNASVFFYSGNKWRNQFAIAYDLPGLNGEFMFLNGSFENVSARSIEFLSRYYSLRDEPTTELLIEEKEGRFEFYQNGASVNYSY
jgi:hypothetical protein